MKTDNEIIIACQAGDKEMYRVLVDKYKNRAYYAALMYTHNRDDALDLSQEAFYRAYKALSSFDTTRNFYTWFYRILVNTCLDSRRRRSRWEKVFSFWRGGRSEKASSDEMNMEYPDPKEYTNPVTALNNKQLSAEIKAALASLPEKQRVVFQLKVLHGMRIREIAQIMGSAEGTVKSHLFRATQFMRDALREWAQP